MKRIALFLVTNIAVIVVLSIVAYLLGVDRYMTQNGLDMRALLIFCAIFGMGGSFISLAMSKTMAKMGTGAKVIEKPSNSAEAWLLWLGGPACGLVFGLGLTSLCRSRALHEPPNGVHPTPRSPNSSCHGTPQSSKNGPSGVLVSTPRRLGGSFRYSS